MRYIIFTVFVISLFAGMGFVGAEAPHHPVGVVSVITPEGLPLDSGNRITCNTCHDFHGKGEGSAMLRKDADSLCVLCHKP